MTFQFDDGKGQTHYARRLLARLNIHFAIVEVLSLLFLALLTVQNVEATSFVTRPLTDTAWDNGYPVISGDIVAWEDFRSAGTVEAPVFAAAGISTYNLSTNTGGLTIPDARLGGFTFSAPLNQVDRSDLAISGDNIVWTSFSIGGTTGINRFNLLEGVIEPLTTLSTNQTSPDISGSRVVWQDPAPNAKGTSGWDLYLYDLGTKTTDQLTTGGTSKYPSIDGTKVVWGDFRTGGFETHLIDVGTKIDQRIDVGLTPDVSGNKIIYTAFTSTSARDIFAFDVGTGENFPLTELATGTRAFISGNRVVYSDNRKGHWQIFLYDLLTKTEFTVTDGLFDAQYPMIDGDRLVYMGDTSGHWQIFETDILSDVPPIVPPVVPPIILPPGPGPVDGVPMPEPTTWMLLGSGLLVMIGLRRFKQIEGARH